jgi:uncharacterized membrane protein YfcA
MLTIGWFASAVCGARSGNPMFDPITLGALAAVGMLAGFVDAIAGGGGLITLPVLLSIGFSPVAAIATNKLQGSIGTGIAVTTYWRRGYVPVKQLLLAFPITLLGSLAGAFVVKRIDTSALQVGFPIALLAVATYFFFAPRLTDEDKVARLPFPGMVPLLGLVLGFYDGLLGPGTGSFFTVGFVTLFGLGITRAAGSTKFLNFASNLGAVILFVPSGDVVWPAAIVMAIGQVVGGYLGALTGIRFGGRLIRPLVVIVSVILALRLLFTH